MSAGSVKTTPRLVDPRIGRQSNPAPVLQARPAPPPEGKWLLYDLPGWIHDDNVKACLSCNTKFTLWNRKHHCRACGGIYCSECSKESWMLPQFNVHTAERLCNFCLKTQATIFDLHAKLTTTRNGLEAHNARYSRLLQCAQTLQVGAMFNVYIDGSMRPRKLALSDDLLMIALINTRTNKVTNAYEVIQISVSIGAHEDARTTIGSSTLCFTMACHDNIFTLQALNSDLFQYWLDGIHLAQEMVMHKERVMEFEQAIADTSGKLHAAIQSQINYAFPKVFPDAVEHNSALTLIADNEGADGENAGQSEIFDSSDSDGEGRSKSRQIAQCGDQSESTNADGSSNADLASSAPPPAALKMGRSVPRQPGYMSPQYMDGARSPTLATSPLSGSGARAVSPSPLARPLSPASSVLSDSSRTPSPSSSQDIARQLDAHLGSSQASADPSEDAKSTSTTPHGTASSSDAPSPANTTPPSNDQPTSSKKQETAGTDSSKTAPSSAPASDAAIAPNNESDSPVVERRHEEAVPPSVDAQAIVSAIMNTSLADSAIGSTFDSLPGTPDRTSINPAPSSTDDARAEKDSTPPNADTTTTVPESAGAEAAVEKEESSAQQT